MNSKFNLLSLSILLTASSLISCGDNKVNGTIVDSFSTYTSVKVCQNVDSSNYYENNKNELKVDVSLMKNESESTQLVFQSGNKVNNYSAVISDLKDAKGNIIPKENITLYVEKYVYLEKKFETSNINFIPGDYLPDCLIPIQNIIDANENYIDANKNQGFIVDIKSNKDTASGIYYGNIEFSFDNKKINVPMKATVWDFAYEGKRDFQSTFWIYKSQLVVGEYDDSDEKIDAYIRMFNDFKVNTELVTQPDYYLADDNYEKYVKYQCDLIDESDNYNTIPIPVTPVPIDYKFSRDRSNVTFRFIYEFIKELVKNSSDEKLYTDYAIFYLSNFDEMDVWPDRFDQGKKFYAKGGELEQLMNYIIECLDSDGYFTKFSNKSKVVDSIKNIVNVNAIVNFKEEIVGKLNLTFCPLLSQFNDDTQTQRYNDAANNVTNGNLWTYTCSGPRYPYPNFHIDDFNLGTRTTGWMMKQKNINGYLYWSVSQFSDFDGTSNGQYVDPYGESWRTAQCPGDGYLCYPGRKYNSLYPFPSLRLLNYRETMDDYDMLEVFDRELEKRSLKYGVSFNSKELLDDLYDSVFKGSVYFQDDSLVLKARNELANRINAVKNYDGIIVKPNYLLDKTSVDIYSVNSRINVNGQSMTGEPSEYGYKFNVSYDLNTQKTLSIIGSAGTYTYDVSAGDNVLDYKNYSDFVFSESSGVTFNNNSAHFVMNSVYRDGASKDNINGATERYRVSATINNNKFKGLSGANLKITNTSGFPITLRLILKGRDIDNALGSIYLDKDQTRELHFSALDFSDAFRNQISAISIQLDNVDLINQRLYDTRSFDISDFVFTTK